MTTLKSEQWEKINEIILDIYSETDVYHLRKTFLRKLAELIPHEKSFFDLGYKKHTKVVFFDPVSNNIEEKHLTSYFKVYEAVDIMFWFFSQNQSNIYRETDYITSAMLRTSVFYNDWMLPQGVHFSMGSRVASDDILYGSVNLWRSEEKGDFTDSEMEILDILNKHLALYFHNRYPNGIRRNNEEEYSDTLIHLYNLTSRESEIVSLIYQGMTSRQIADKLFISENTVKKHTYNIFKKMKVSSRSQIIKIIHGLSTTSVDSITSEQMKKLSKSAAD